MPRNGKPQDVMTDDFIKSSIEIQITIAFRKNKIKICIKSELLHTFHVSEVYLYYF